MTRDLVAPLSTAIPDLLWILAGGVRDRSVLELWGRTVSGNDNGRRLLVRSDQVAPGLIPGLLLSTLEEHAWSLHLGIAVRAHGMSGQLARLCAIPATWAISDVRTAGRWRPDLEEIALVRSRLDAFVLPPTVVVFGGNYLRSEHYTVTALYALNAPMTDFPRGLRLTRRLAQALGAADPRPDATLSDLSLHLPGTLIREGDGRHEAEFWVCEPERRYPVDQFDAALEEAKAS